MRFFTNESKDNTDEQGGEVQTRAEQESPEQARDDAPESVQSEPVAVPPQRAGSPWSDAPGSTPDNDREDTVAVADSAEPDGTPAESTAYAGTPPDSDPATTASSTTTYGPDGKPADDTRGEDAALKDEGGFDDPTAVDPDTEKPLDADEPTTPDTTGTDADAAPAVAADTATATEEEAPSETPSADTTPAETDTPPAEPAVVAAGADGAAEAAASKDAKPGAVAAPELGTLFGEQDARALQERWREVQLRFVDSPKEATDEAGGLVDEAVEKLTASLRGQKDALAQDSDDTERLRVQLRGYREILNRLISL
ncbi:hypothetical protein [Mangrovihabitans endophyticus]|uniref:Uncharacterized protein n=1 Tax=Mangrovihabitans endophyticus TaxID=1751298 RepID=A0A8J3C334_9ACTN|nr:hypothetical protein [Mangrovihabitans endophyticus]GGL02307.1 hypothetical protein GCM10012284_40990 [Mangrovihabitans endophyticus]